MPVEVLRDVTWNLPANQTAVETRTHSSEMCTHNGQYSRLPGMHTLVTGRLLYRAFRNHTKSEDVKTELALHKGIFV